MRCRELMGVAAFTLQLAACSGTSSSGDAPPPPAPGSDGGGGGGGGADGGGGGGGGGTDAGTNGDSSSGTGGDAGGTGGDGGLVIPVADCDGGLCIKHLVVIVQENHTFDTHFGGYCTAAAGSSPTCTLGPACCEAMPAKDPGGTAPTALTDQEHAAFSPNHNQSCEISEIDNGKMDGFATGSAGCGSARNVALADPAIIKPYWDLAGGGALADRYFQPVAGASSSNDMYLARASFVFTDNSSTPKGALGLGCNFESGSNQYADTTIGDLLTAASVSWTWFSDGYKTMSAAGGSCPAKPSDCGFFLSSYPCAYDPSDVPFNYYASSVDNAATLKDISALDTAIASGTGLPAVSFVKALGYKSEHPGTSVTLSAGVKWASGLIARIEASAYGPSTLVLLTYDEGGGYFDHVAPPASSAIDGKPYGTRVPLLAVGPFARKNTVSHVTMEHSSIVKFIEWNWLGQTTGQLGTRDTVIANIGSVLDPSTTGIAVPEN